MYHEIIRTVLREKQYEVWLNLYDDDCSLIIGNYIFVTGPVALPAVAVNNRIKAQVYPKFQNGIEESEKIYLQSEVTKILIEKGYLIDGQIFPDDLEPNISYEVLK